jgi:AbrB family looped-hinge helix DNA binding protein
VLGVIGMEETTVSSGYQIVIPKPIRERIGLQQGQKLSAILKGGVIYLVPIPELQELRGVAKGVDVHHVRDEADRT